MKFTFENEAGHSASLLYEEKNVKPWISLYMDVTRYKTIREAAQKVAPKFIMHNRLHTARRSSVCPKLGQKQMSTRKKRVATEQNHRSIKIELDKDNPYQIAMEELEKLSLKTMTERKRVQHWKQICRRKQRNFSSQNLSKNKMISSCRPSRILNSKF